MGSIALVNWSVDPLQHYRPASYPAHLVEPSRFRLPGLARHTKAAIAIAGTSVSKHQQTAEVERVFGGSAINLAMDGASAREQHLLLRLALRFGSIREVIWDVNFEYLRGASDWVSDYDGTFPAFLYDDQFANDLPRYLLSIDTCKQSARVIAGAITGRPPSALTPEGFQKFDPAARYGPSAVAASLERRRKGAAQFRALLPQFAPGLLEESFAQNFAALIREFPRVRFHLYFPPFSQAYFDFTREIAPELLPRFIKYRKAVYDRVQALPNAVLHDPQSDSRLINDSARYSDPIHFNPETHTLLLEGIHDGRWRATPERLDALQKALR